MLFTPVLLEFEILNWSSQAFNEGKTELHRRRQSECEPCPLAARLHPAAREPTRSLGNLSRLYHCWGCLWLCSLLQAGASGASLPAAALRPSLTFCSASDAPCQASPSFPQCSSVPGPALGPWQTGGCPPSGPPQPTHTAQQPEDEKQFYHRSQTHELLLP